MQEINVMSFLLCIAFKVLALKLNNSRGKRETICMDICAPADLNTLHLLIYKQTTTANLLTNYTC